MSVDYIVINMNWRAVGAQRSVCGE